MLSIHPGWVGTAMGTLDGFIAGEMELSVIGIADVVERHMGSGDVATSTGGGRPLDW